MLQIIKELINLLTKEQKKRLCLVQILVIATAIAEIVGMATIAPFMALIGDLTMLGGDNLYAQLYRYSNLSTPYEFILWVGIGVLFTLSVTAILSMLTTWRLAMFAAEVGTEYADRLYAHYLNQNWLFHANTSTAVLSKQIAIEAVRVTDLIILPLILMNAKIVLIVLLLSAIVIFDPVIAILGISLFSLGYCILYIFNKKRLAVNGRMLSDVATTRFRLMNEAFGGVKDVILTNRAPYFNQQFRKSGQQFAYARGNNHVLWQVPRYFMELITFGSMIGLVLFLVISNDGNLGVVLPILAAYALASFKLLPAFQQVYTSIGQIKGNIAAYESIRKDLYESSQDGPDKIKEENFTEELSLLHIKDIRLNSVNFTYSTSKKPALIDVKMRIKGNSTIGIVGPSGSGKSTVLDIILGLIEPNAGELKVNNITIGPHNRASWQRRIGFVPQNIFLSEGTISENVAFGLPKKDINLEQVKNALQQANLYAFVSDLEKGLDTKVGERGVKLSGGQRQRIAIARALYSNAEILIFDEATSALDGITEKSIMESIHNLLGKKTIIMVAHRIKTVRNCDQIFLMESGRVVDSGTYENLQAQNDYFKALAEHA